MKKVWSIIVKIVGVIGVIAAIVGASRYVDKFFNTSTTIQKDILEEVHENKESTDSLKSAMTRYQAETNAHREAKKEQTGEIDHKLDNMSINLDVLIENQPDPEEIINEIRRRRYLYDIHKIEPIGDSIHITPVGDD